MVRGLIAKYVRILIGSIRSLSKKTSLVTERVSLRKYQMLGVAALTLLPTGAVAYSSYTTNKPSQQTVGVSTDQTSDKSSANLDAKVDGSSTIPSISAQDNQSHVSVQANNSSSGEVKVNGENIQVPAQARTSYSVTSNNGQTKVDISIHNYSTSTSSASEESEDGSTHVQLNTSQELDFNGSSMHSETEVESDIEN